MNSKIIQISETPIPKSKRIDASMLDGTLVGVMDRDSKETKGDYGWIFGDKEIFALNEKERTVTIKNRMKYFQPRFEKWKEALADIQGITFEEFAGNEREMNAWSLNQVYEGTYEVYMSDNEGCCQTFTSWMRSVKDGETFHLGATFEYYC